MVESGLGDSLVAQEQLDRLFEDKRFQEIYLPSSEFTAIFERVAPIMEGRLDSGALNTLREATVELASIAKCSAHSHALLALLYERLAEESLMFKHLAISICLSPKLISAHMELLRIVQPGATRELSLGLLFSIHSIHHPSCDVKEDSTLSDEQLSGELDRLVGNGWW